MGRGIDCGIEWDCGEHLYYYILPAFVLDTVRVPYRTSPCYLVHQHNHIHSMWCTAAGFLCYSNTNVAAGCGLPRACNNLGFSIKHGYSCIGYNYIHFPVGKICLQIVLYQEAPDVILRTLLCVPQASGESRAWPTRRHRYTRMTSAK